MKFYYNKEKYAFPLQIFFLNKNLDLTISSESYNAKYRDTILIDILQ